MKVQEKSCLFGGRYSSTTSAGLYNWYIDAASSYVHIDTGARLLKYE